MKEEKRLKRKVRYSYFISTLSIALVLYLLSLVGYISGTMFEMGSSLKRGIVISVEVERNIDSLATVELPTRLESFDAPLSVSLLSKEQKVVDEDFKELFGEDFESLLGENPFSDTYEVTIAGDTVDYATYDRFAAFAAEIEGVESVYYPRLLVEQLQSSVGSTQMLLIIFGAIMFIISLILLANTTRLAIYSRRYLINTMKMVGATKWFIMRPFLWSSIKCGFTAGVIAVTIFAGSIYVLRETLPDIANIASAELVAVIAGTIVALGVLISLIFTLFAVNSFINMKSNKIYLY